MKKSIFLIIFLFPLISFSQKNEKTFKARFHPFVELNYNRQNISYINQNMYYPYRSSYSLNSNFFGGTFGFELLPKKENGYYFYYENKLLPELGIKELYGLSGSNTEYTITGNNISSGFFGKLSAGKEIFSNDFSKIIAGVSLGDRYISGTNGIYYGQEIIEYEGFHLTPGIFAELNSKISEKYSLSINAGLSQSVLNFWRFAENGSDFNFRHPLFFDFSVKIKHKSGFYLVIGNSLMIPYRDMKSSSKITFGIGFYF